MSSDSPTMKGTKNPGKLNTSFWEQQAFKDDKKNNKSVKKKGPRKKKKKTKMTAMWENKYEKQKKQVESTSIPKRSSITKNTNTSSPIIKSNENNTENIDNNTPLQKPDNTETTDNNTINKSETETETKPKPKKINRVSALAGKLNINPKGMMGMGGLPPILKKKREEKKENDGELPTQDFPRPIIPKTIQRKKATRKDIISITNNKINNSLRTHLLESFEYDKCMIISPNNLCTYLRDVALIDLSATSDKIWDLNILINAVKDVFGEQAIMEYGYNLKAI